MLNRSILSLILLGFVAISTASAQQNATPKPSVPVMSQELAAAKAMVYVLQAKLLKVEQELGEEKTRRAQLEFAVLQKAVDGLDPAVKKALGLPVQQAKDPPPVTAPEKPKD